MTMSDQPDINFLMTQPIGDILIKGLGQTYLKAPQFPIDFLAKWLLNYNETKQQEIEFQKSKKILQEFKQVQELNVQLQQQQQQVLTEEKSQKQQHFNQFLEELKSHPYTEEYIDTKYPEFLKKVILQLQEFGLTGVYICKLELPTIEVDQFNDEQYAHLDVANPKVLKYIGSDNDHYFIKQIAVSQELGINSKIFKTEVAEEEEQQETKKEDYIYVDSVVQEPKIHFFKFPKLGSYMAVPLKINNYLSETLFNEQLEDRINFKKLEVQYLQEFEEKERQFNEQKEQILLRDNSEELQSFEAQYKEEMALLVKPVQKQLSAIQEQYIFCCDTLGQDKGISEQNRLKICQYFQQCWENQQQTILNQIIDNQIYFNENIVLVDFIEIFNTDEQNFVQDNMQQIPVITLNQQNNENESYVSFKQDQFRLEFLHQSLQNETIMRSFQNLLQFRQIKYQLIFQTLLYQLLRKKEEINIESTNILNWKLISQQVINILNELKNYQLMQVFNFRGPKPEQIPEYMKINRQLARLEKINQEEVQTYNLALSFIYRIIKLTIKLRKKDIEIRRQNQARLKEERINQIAHFEQHKHDFQKARQDQLIQFSENKQVFVLFQEDAETEESFIEKWETEYLTENQPPNIPEEVIDDIDNDLEAGELA